MPKVLVARNELIERVSEWDDTLLERFLEGQPISPDELRRATRSAVTRLLLGRKIPDTQSGFRLHSRRFLEVVVQDVAGGRYETEMEILVKAVLGGYEVVSVPIRTIYERGNPSSHFRRMRDSWRVWRALFITALSCGRQSALGDLARKRLHGSVTEQGERE